MGTKEPDTDVSETEILVNNLRTWLWLDCTAWLLGIVYTFQIDQEYWKVILINQTCVYYSHLFFIVAFPLPNSRISL